MSQAHSATYRGTLALSRQAGNPCGSGQVWQAGTDAVSPLTVAQLLGEKPQVAVLSDAHLPCPSAVV